MPRWFPILLLAPLACALPGGASPNPLPPSPSPEPRTATAAIEPSPDTPEPTATSVPSLPDPATARWEVVAEGLSSPVDLQHAGDGRLFVVEQRGRILLFHDGQIADLAYLDIRDLVDDSGNERGLLGLAFDPGFSSNGYFYVNFTGEGGDTFIMRFRADPAAASIDPSTASLVLTYDQPFPNHNGGGMVFGPDGYLYIGSGDGGAAGDPFGNGQSLDALLGKILRLDVASAEPYAIPPDNPLASGGGRGEIWDYGLRNPWRFSFDPATRDLLIADVGQGDWEEIDLHPASVGGGLNFGWNIREGAHAFAGAATAGLVDPIAEYEHSFGRCSVTGGPVVRDPELPLWQGVYLYADYCTGEIWGAVPGSDGLWTSDLLYTTDFRVTSFGTDVNGRVYVLDRNGRIARLTSTAP